MRHGAEVNQRIASGIASVRLRNEILFALPGLDRSPVCSDLEAAPRIRILARSEGSAGAVKRVKLRCGLLLSETRATLIPLCGSHDCKTAGEAREPGKISFAD